MGSQDPCTRAPIEASTTTAAASRPVDLAEVDRRPVAIAFGVFLLGFWPTLLSFPPTWNASYQEQGFFVGGLVAWLLWRDRDRFFRSARSGLADLLPAVALVSLGWLFAVVMNVRLIHQLLFLAIATLWAFAVFGWHARRWILPVSVTALLGIPVWSVLMPTLQRATVIASGAATRLAGIEAEVGYDYITITTGTFLVESGCSGINYLMGGLVLGAYYAHLFTDRWQTQLKIVGVAAAMSIVGNWIRVTILIFLGEATAMQSPYIEDHLWQGWAIFTLLMIPTYFLARTIERRDATKPRDPTASVSPGEGMPAQTGLEGDDVELVDDADRGRLAMLATACACVGPILYVAVGAVPRSDEVDRDPGVFGVTESWSVEPVEAAGLWTPSYHGYDDRGAWLLRSDAGTIEAGRLYFADQRQGEELIQYDNRIAPDSLTALDRLVGPIGPERRFVHETIILDGERPRVVWYWYRVAGFDTPFETKAKILEILGFFTRASASELVVMSAGCAPEDCAEAGTLLRASVGIVPPETEPDP